MQSKIRTAILDYLYGKNLEMAGKINLADELSECVQKIIDANLPKTEAPAERWVTISGVKYKMEEIKK